MRCANVGLCQIVAAPLVFVSAAGFMGCSCAGGQRVRPRLLARHWRACALRASLCPPAFLFPALPLAEGADYRPPYAFAASRSRVLKAALPLLFPPHGQPSKSPLAASLRFGAGAPAPSASVK